jgi:chaperonin cofactor prefoldin
MAGASDPAVAAALEAQAKSIDVQSRTLATQSKLLQQLCDRLEFQDNRWQGLERNVNLNSDSIAQLHEKMGNGARIDA